MINRMRQCAGLAAVCVTAVFLISVWLVQMMGQTAVQAEDSAVVVRAYFDERQQVWELASWREPWDVDYEAGFVTLDATGAEIAELERRGFLVEVDEELTAVYTQPRIQPDGITAGIPGFSCYRTVEETYADAAALAAANPTLASWIDIGDSWQKTAGLGGYDLQVLKLTNTAVPGSKPKLFIMASMHAREYTPAELATRFAEQLVAAYGVDADATWLLDYNEIHLLLQANPDGRKQAETGQLWRKNTNENYCTLDSTRRGADLNRNYVFGWGGAGSSGNVCDETYRGLSAASEPETQAVQNYVRTIFPDQRPDELTAAAPVTATGVFLDIHSYSQLVLWPWGNTSTVAPNGTALQTLGRKLAYFNGYEAQQAFELYPTDGTTDDFAYGELGLAAYTFELGDWFFQECGAFENGILPDNLEALRYAAKAARTPYLTPAGPDVSNLVVTPALVPAGLQTTITAVVNDTRFRAGTGEPTQSVAAVALYVDTPPWQDGAVAVAGTAVDGNFDETVEGITAVVDTFALVPGRHTLFMQAQDADGNWGAVSAIFLDVGEGTFEPRAYFPVVKKD